jgi:hypothetical protein
MSGICALDRVHGKRTNAIGKLASCGHLLLCAGKTGGSSEFAIVERADPSLCGHGAGCAPPRALNNALSGKADMREFTRDIGLNV